MKNTLVTSEIPQVQATIDMVGVSVMNGVKDYCEGLTTASRQRILAQGNVLINHLVAGAKVKMTELTQIVGHLKLISGDTEIVIGETDGTDTIANASDVFTGRIDPDFVNYGTNVKGQPTKKTKVQVFEVIKDGTFIQTFGGFGENLDRLCLTQNQIKLFVKDHSKWLLKNGYGTFFLFKEKGEYFVIGVYLGDGGFRAIMLLNDVCHGCLRRVVVPQL